MHQTQVPSRRPLTRCVAVAVAGPLCAAVPEAQLIWHKAGVVVVLSYSIS